MRTPAYEPAGVQLGRRWLTAHPPVRDKLFQMAESEPAGRVRFEIALALGDVIGEHGGSRGAGTRCRHRARRRMDSPGRRHEPRSTADRRSFAQIVDRLESNSIPRPSRQTRRWSEKWRRSSVRLPEISAVEQGLRSLDPLLQSISPEMPDARKAAILLAGIDGLARGTRRRGHSIGSEFFRSQGLSLPRMMAIATHVAKSGMPAAIRHDAIEVLRLLSPPKQCPIS